MNLFGLRAIRRLPAAASALTLLAAAIGSAQAAPVEDYGINYTWVEGGWSRHNDRADSFNSDYDGGYLRGSFALGDSFYLLGGYSRNTGSDSFTNGNTAKLTGKIGQIELGLGFHVPMAEKLDFIGELSAIRFSYDYDVKINGVKQDNVDYRDNSYAGKAMVGLRAKPFDMVDIWAKGGYFRMKQDDAMFPVERSALANVGIQLQLTPNLGLVGEADFYKKDYRYYRAGVRVSF